MLIATYTVVDGLGVRAAGSELGYILWLFLFEIVPIGAVLLATRPIAWIAFMRSNVTTVLFGGIASSAAYGLVIFCDEPRRDGLSVEFARNECDIRSIDRNTCSA